jgi:hypothetical protein
MQRASFQNFSVSSALNNTISLTTRITLFVGVAIKIIGVRNRSQIAATLSTPAFLRFPAVYSHQTALVSCFGCLLLARVYGALKKQRVQHNQRVQLQQRLCWE